MARSLASRMLRGLLADASWRRRQVAAVHAASGRRIGRSLSRSVIRIGLGVACVLAIPLVAMVFSNQVTWSLSDFTLAGVLLTTIGVAQELAVRRAGRRSTSIGIAATGLGAGIVGQADDAPGLVLLGILLILSAAAMAVRM